jgi:hypothetical protein
LTGSQTLIARTALSVASGMCSIVAVSSSYLNRLPRQTFDRFVIRAMIVSRLAVYFGLFFVLRFAPRGDIPAYYWQEGNNVLSGLLPYRDFPSSYAPLHPYLDAWLIRMWHSPLSIIIFSVCAELVLLPIWLRVGRAFLSEQELRTGALLYLSSAISLQFVAIDGQDNVVVAMCLAFAVFLLFRNRLVASGAALGLSAVMIKFLPFFYAPAFLLAAPRRWRWVAGMALPVGLVYGIFAAKRLPVLSVLGREGGMRSANNLPFLAEGILGITIPARIWDGLVLCVIVAILLVAATAMRRAPFNRRLRILTFCMAALTLAIVLFSKKSWPPYLMLALFPICLAVPVRSKLMSAAFAFFGVAAIIEPSYWSTILRQFSAQEFHRGLLADQRNCMIFLILQCILVAGYSCLLLRSMSLMLSSPGSTPEDKVSTELVSAHAA